MPLPHNLRHRQTPQRKSGKDKKREKSSTPKKEIQSQSPSQKQQHEDANSKEKDERDKATLSYGKQELENIFTPSWFLAFRIISLIRITAAITSPILDCDEVYNYWESIHLIHFGYGKQTWEYQPNFALRSWAFSWIYAGVGNLLHFFLALRYKYQLFILTRMTMGLFCAACEATFVWSISKWVDRRISNYTLVMLATSAGMYHASVAFLPSSFSMYFVMLGSAFSFKSPSLLESKRIVYALQLFGIGAIFGWPYAAIISFPAIIEELFIRGSDQIPGRAKVDVLMQVLRKWRVRRINSVLRGVISGASLLLVVGAVDSYYYDRITLSLWNAVKYNLFGGSKRGPDLYGTEPWTYYFANGFINFNIVFVFALLSLPLWGCQYVLWRILDKISTRKSRKKHRVIDEYLPVRREPTHPHMLLLIRMIPFYLVLAIFTLQPHKEERFLYIIYPYICFNGAVSLHLVRSLFNEVAVILGSGGFIRSTVATSGKLNWLFLTISTVLSTMRIFALFHYYSRAASLFMALPGFADTPNVPMDFSVSLKALLPSTISGIDHSLHNPSELEKSKITNVCIGKEWHRFPSHYFMPHNYHLRFLQTPAFKGQLPGDFLPVTNSLRESTSHIQKTFNDMNREEPSHYWKESKCDYVVDIDWTAIPDSVYHEKSEPLPYARQTGKWEKVRCAPYLDKDRSKALGRVFYTPEKAKVFIVKLKNWFLGRKDPEKEAEELDTWIQWGEACLLKPKK